MIQNRFVITGLILALVAVMPVMAELNFSRTDDGKVMISNGTYWIKWDPLGDHIVGDKFYVNGTTNLARGTVLEYGFASSSDGCHTKFCPDRKLTGTGGKILIGPGNDSTIQTISIFINTTGFESYEYTFLFSSAFGISHGMGPINLYPEEMRDAIHSHNLTVPHDSGITHWISVPSWVDYSSTCCTLTGTTNLPVGENVSYSFFMPVDYGPDSTLNPDKIDVQNRISGGTVIPGEIPGINKLVITVNTSELSDGEDVIIWNPRYNISDVGESVSATSFFHRQNQFVLNDSLTCLPVTSGKISTTSAITFSPKPTSLPLSVLDTFMALLATGIFSVWLMRKGGGG